MNTLAAHALIVEDDDTWQQILSEILTDAGLTVEVAKNLDEASVRLRAASHRLAVVDLTLSSQDHHNQDGLRVLDAVKLYNPGCVTIMLTGYATVELAVSVLTKHGAFTCLRKESFNRSEFHETIQRALATPPPAITPGIDMVTTPTLPAKQNAIQEMPIALAVEDDAGWRDILAELLNDAGYQTRLCTSFGEALGYLRREKYSLAVVDLSLEGTSLLPHGPHVSAKNMDGYRLLASTRAGGIPTIVVSGVGTPAEVERAFAEQGIFAYLEKQSFDRRAFLRTVNEAQIAARSNNELDVLTPREREVLELLARGMTNKEIAEVLVITTNTVKRHLKAIFEKLEIHTRSAATAKAIGAGIANEPEPIGSKELYKNE